MQIPVTEVSSWPARGFELLTKPSCTVLLLQMGEDVVELVEQLLQVEVDDFDVDIDA